MDINVTWGVEGKIIAGDTHGKNTVEAGCFEWVTGDTKQFSRSIECID